MDKQELIDFLKENLRVNVWCDYDGCDSPQVNVGIYICDEKINEASDYLLRVNQYEKLHRYRTKQGVGRDTAT